MASKRDPPKAKWRCKRCDQTHVADAPYGASEGDEYDGYCPACKHPAEMTVKEIKK